MTARNAEVCLQRQDGACHGQHECADDGVRGDLAERDGFAARSRATEPAAEASRATTRRAKTPPSEKWIVSSRRPSAVPSPLARRGNATIHATAATVSIASVRERTSVFSSSMNIDFMAQFSF